jgi:metal iron transporter
MAIIISKIGPDWGDAFHGFIPSKQIFEQGGLYTCENLVFHVFPVCFLRGILAVGIVGATVMPHSLFLGSALATQDRITPPKRTNSFNSLAGETLTERPQRSVPRWLCHKVASIFRVRPIEDEFTRARTHEDHVNHSLGFVRAHLNHGIVDVVTSLLGFAVMINSL